MTSPTTTNIKPVTSRARGPELPTAINTTPRVSYPTMVLTPRGVWKDQTKRGSEDLIFREFVPRQRNSRRKVDDPRGEDTGASSSGALPGCRGWQRESSVSGAGDLAFAVLPVEEETFSVRSRGVASAPAGVPARAATEGRSPRRAGRPGHGFVLADVGSQASVGAAGSRSDAGSSQHRPSSASACGPLHAP